LIQGDGVAAAGQVEGAVSGFTRAGIPQGAAAADHDLGIGIGFRRAQAAVGFAFGHAVERIDAEGAAGDDGLAGVCVGAGDFERSRAAFLERHAAAARTFGIRDMDREILHRRGVGRIQAEGGAGHQTVPVDASGDVLEQGCGLRDGEFACAADMQPQFARGAIDADIGRGPARGIIVVERRHDL